MRKNLSVSAIGAHKVSCPPRIGVKLHKRGAFCCDESSSPAPRIKLPLGKAGMGVAWARPPVAVRAGCLSGDVKLVT
eukprot:2202935-Alexandrium_andersonii.AAC.1